MLKVQMEQVMQDKVMQMHLMCSTAYQIQDYHHAHILPAGSLPPWLLHRGRLSLFLPRSGYRSFPKWVAVIFLCRKRFVQRPNSSARYHSCYKWYKAPLSISYIWLYILLLPTGGCCHNHTDPVPGSRLSGKSFRAYPRLTAHVPDRGRFPATGPNLRDVKKELP